MPDVNGLKLESMTVVVAFVVATWKNFNFVYIFLILILFSVGESANEKKTKRKLCVEKNIVKEVNV